jgi:hypothetical protein
MSTLDQALNGIGAQQGHVIGLTILNSLTGIHPAHGFDEYFNTPLFLIDLGQLRQNGFGCHGGNPPELKGGCIVVHGLERLKKEVFE